MHGYHVWCCRELRDKASEGRWRESLSLWAVYVTIWTPINYSRHLIVEDEGMAIMDGWCCRVSLEATNRPISTFSLDVLFFMTPKGLRIFNACVALFQAGTGIAIFIITDRKAKLPW
jgi:hypothetical protein